MGIYLLRQICFRFGLHFCGSPYHTQLKSLCNLGILACCNSNLVALQCATKAATISSPAILARFVTALSAQSCGLSAAYSIHFNSVSVISIVIEGILFSPV